jgi:hypothetical protein
MNLHCVQGRNTDVEEVHSFYCKCKGSKKKDKDIYFIKYRSKIFASTSQKSTKYAWKLITTINYYDQIKLVPKM